LRLLSKVLLLNAQHPSREASKWLLLKGNPGSRMASFLCRDKLCKGILTGALTGSMFALHFLNKEEIIESAFQAFSHLL
jgi:hypothetical protein